MALDRWDIIAVPSQLLGLPEDRPDPFGVVISSTVTRDHADRLWMLLIPNPGPKQNVYGDVPAPQLSRVIPARPPVIRTSTVFTVLRRDVGDQAIAQVSLDHQRQVLRFLDMFLPRR
ncbi:MAG: hypothetical protein ACFB6R_02100 [Alphaproteobacteria bacterium]